MALPDPGDWPVADPVSEPAGDLLRERTGSTPDRLAVLDADTGKQWSFGEFDDRVSRRVERLEGRFGAADGRVGVLLDAGVAFADLYFATERRGATAVPLNVELPAETLGAQAERAGLDLLVCERDTEGLATTVAPDGVPVASVDEPASSAVESLSLARTAATWPFETTLDADRLVLFTSGTTGEPKGVRLTRRNLVASAVGSADRLGVDPADRWLVCLPMYHMGGLAPLVRSTLYGTTTVLQRSFDAGETAAAMAEYGVTGVSLVPTMLRRLLDAGWTPPDSLRFVLLGGGPASEDLLARAADRGVPVYPTYGATETASQVATATPSEAREYTGTVGRPLSTVEVSVRDDGSAVPRGERGEVVVAGPTVAPGYLDAERTAAAFGPAGFHTGDVGYRDEGGRLWVVGRLDDRIVTGGENVQPARVVDALRGVDGVADAAVVGLPDEQWGERVTALVVPAADLTPEAVRAGVRERLADYAVPKTVGFADALPRTPSGTVDREAVAERLRDAGDGPPE